MKRKINEIWEEKKGSRKVWKVQAPKGVMVFTKKEIALKWVEATKEALK